MPASRLRACFKIRRGPAAGDFGRGQGGEFRASPQRAVRNESTQATGKRPAARRVFAQKARWLRCASVTAPSRCSLVAPRHRALCAKTGPLLILKQALGNSLVIFMDFRGKDDSRPQLIQKRRDARVCGPPQMIEADGRKT